MAFLAYHFNWSYESLMEMEHAERHLWCQEVSRINERLSGGAGGSKEVSIERLI